MARLDIPGEKLMVEAPEKPTKTTTETVDDFIRDITHLTLVPQADVLDFALNIRQSITESESP